MKKKKQSYRKWKIKTKTASKNEENDIGPMISFFDLCVDVQRHILHWIPFFEKVRLRRVCKGLKAIVDETPNFICLCNSLVQCMNLGQVKYLVHFGMKEQDRPFLEWVQQKFKVPPQTMSKIMFRVDKTFAKKLHRNPLYLFHEYTDICKRGKCTCLFDFGYDMEMSGDPDVKSLVDGFKVYRFNDNYGAMFRLLDSCEREFKRTFNGHYQYKEYKHCLQKFFHDAWKKNDKTFVEYVYNNFPYIFFRFNSGETTHIPCYRIESLKQYHQILYAQGRLNLYFEHIPLLPPILPITLPLAKTDYPFSHNLLPLASCYHNETRNYISFLINENCGWNQCPIDSTKNRRLLFLSILCFGRFDPKQPPLQELLLSTESTEDGLMAKIKYMPFIAFLLDEKLKLEPWIKENAFIHLYRYNISYLSKNKAMANLIFHCFFKIAILNKFPNWIMAYRNMEGSNQFIMTNEEENALSTKMWKYPRTHYPLLEGSKKK